MEEHRQPSLRDLGGQRHVTRADRGQNDRDPGPERTIYDLQRLAEPAALAFRQRDLVVPALVHHGFPPPHLAADVYHLAGAAQRRVVEDTVEALDHLWPGRAEPEPEPPPGDEVQARGGHRGQRRGTGVELQDGGGDLQPAGPRRDEAELADRVKGVRLGDRDDVEPGLLEILELGDSLREATAVTQRHADPHYSPRFRPQ